MCAGLPMACANDTFSISTHGKQLLFIRKINIPQVVCIDVRERLPYMYMHAYKQVQTKYAYSASAFTVKNISISMQID